MALPAANSSVNQLLQLGIEDVDNLGSVAATARLQTIDLMPSPKTDGQEIDQMGAKIALGYVLGKEWSEHKIAGTGSFGEIVYLLSAFLGVPTVTPLPSPVGSPAKQWKHTSSYLTPDVLQRFTAEYGNGTRDQQYGGLFGSELQIKIDRSKIEFGGTMIGQALVDNHPLTVLTPVNQVWTLTATGTPASGTFSLQLGTLGTPVDVPYNATPPQVAAALNTLAAPYGGNFTASGGPLPASPVTVTATGFLGQKSQPNLTVDNASLTGGTMASAITTPGHQVAPESIIVPFSPALFDFFVDDTPDALGTTQLPDGISLNITLGNRQGPKWRINSSDSGTFQRAVETKIKGTVELVAEDDALGMQFLASMRANQQKFLRFQAGGPDIDGANSYLWQLDLCCNMTSPKEFKDETGIWAVTWDGSITANPVWGAYMQSTIVNTLPSLTFA